MMNTVDDENIPHINWESEGGICDRNGFYERYRCSAIFHKQPIWLECEDGNIRNEKELLLLVAKVA